MFGFIPSRGKRMPDVFELIKVPVKSHTNHGRNAEYFCLGAKTFTRTSRR